MSFPMMYSTLLYVNSKSKYDNLKKYVSDFIGDIWTLDSAVCGIFLNGDIFFEKFQNLQYTHETIRNRERNLNVLFKVFELNYKSI